MFRHNSFAPNFRSSQKYSEILAWTPWSIRLSTGVHKDGGRLGRTGNNQLVHVKAAVGKLMGLAISYPGEERLRVAMAQTLRWSHQQWKSSFIKEGTWWQSLCSLVKDHFVERGPFGCWKGLSNNQGCSDIRGGWYSHAGTYFEIPWASWQIHLFFIHSNIYFLIPGSLILITLNKCFFPLSHSKMYSLWYNNRKCLSFQKNLDSDLAQVNAELPLTLSLPFLIYKTESRLAHLKVLRLCNGLVHSRCSSNVSFPVIPPPSRIWDWDCLIIQLRL